jgi:hypothetical protein
VGAVLDSDRVPVSCVVVEQVEILVAHQAAQAALAGQQ